jgi:hypothetical protein
MRSESVCYADNMEHEVPVSTNNHWSSTPLQRQESTMYVPNTNVTYREASAAAQSAAAQSAAANRRPTKISAPPMQYNLGNATGQVVCKHIDELTANANLESPEFVANLKEVLLKRHPDPSIIFGYIPAPPNGIITKQVIGEKGYFFKMTTTVCGVYFIWHDIVNNMFLFWGPSKFKVVKAMNSIRWRIAKIIEQSNQAVQAQRGAFPGGALANAESARRCLHIKEECDDNDDEDEMPALISQGNTPDYETHFD